MDLPSRRHTPLPLPRIRQNRLLTTIGWLLAVALSACSGGGSSDEASRPRAEDSQATGATASGGHDPCVLVTGAEAEQVLGGPVETERPAEANNEYLATCRYVAMRGAGVAVLVVKVSRQSGTAGFQNARRMGEEGIAIQPVSGVGDDAFWVADPLHTLYVLQDTTYLDIGGDVQLEEVRPLALNALQRLR